MVCGHAGSVGLDRFFFFPQVLICVLEPTGGVSLANAREYLALENVLCVGGSWVAPADLMAAGDWDGIAGLARDAAALK